MYNDSSTTFVDCTGKIDCGMCDYENSIVEDEVKEEGGRGASLAT